MLQFDANAHADANIEARVNGPLLIHLPSSINGVIGIPGPHTLAKPLNFL